MCQGGSGFQAHSKVKIMLTDTLTLVSGLTHTQALLSCTFLAITSAIHTLPKQAWEPAWKGQVMEKNLVSHPTPRPLAGVLIPPFLLFAT